MNGPKSPTPKSWLGSITARAGAGTALLVAVAALINGGVDVYKAVLKVPRNIYERTNEELFKKHFGKPPIVSQPVPIKASGITVEMLLQVFDTGDVFIRYGDFQQWLPFHQPKTALEAFFAEAFAQSLIASGPPRAVPKGPLGVDTLIDVDKLKREQLELRPTGNVIERSYTLAEMKDDHPSFLNSSSQTYTRIIEAEAGFKITKYDFQLGSANNHRIDSVELSGDGRTLRVTFVLTSGPAIDRWRGWVQATVKTLQERIR